MKHTITRIALGAVVIGMTWLAPLALLDTLAGRLLPALAGQHGLAAAQAPFDRGLLWRIERPGVPASHVFGTIHLSDARVTALPAPVRERFDAARSFTMEVSLDAANLATLARRMVFDDDRTLPAVAGEALYQRAVPLLEGLGVPQGFARMLKPWAAMLMLALPPQPTDDVLDLRLFREASAQRKPAYFLETVEEQVAAFDEMADSDQVALLAHTVETYAELPTLQRRLMEAYLQRDLAAMWQVNEAEVRRRPQLKPLSDVFAERLIYDRNARMAQRMHALLAKGGAFIAVGALHLYGARGVLSLLERDGWRVTRAY
jgi:uncharacterized protein YbaP (TraB family)